MNDDPPSGDRGPRSTRPARSARSHLMDLLARRNYSVLEIRKKFAGLYSENEIEAALAFARESKWLLPEDELSERVAAALARKRKGHRFVNQYLKSKGLPPVRKNSNEEFENALALVQAKLAKLAFTAAPALSSQKAGSVARQTIRQSFQQKARRLLANRGFDDETIRAVIAAALKQSPTDVD